MSLTLLQRRCVDVAYRKRLTHVSCALDAVGPLAGVYEAKAERDLVVMGNAHAALAQWVVLESLGLADADEMVDKHGTHATRDPAHGVHVSGGSLGQAETVAVGLAMADRSRKVWLLTSDGACMEGAVWESFRLASHCAPNLRVGVVFNGRGAYGRIDERDVQWAVAGLRPKAEIHRVEEWTYPEWLRGEAGHYLTLSREQYKELMHE